MIRRVAGEERVSNREENGTNNRHYRRGIKANIMKEKVRVQKLNFLKI